MSKYEQESGQYAGSNVVCVPVHPKRSRLKKRQIFSSLYKQNPSFLPKPTIEKPVNNNNNNSSSDSNNNKNDTIASNGTVASNTTTITNSNDNSSRTVTNKTENAKISEKVNPKDNYETITAENNDKFLASPDTTDIEPTYDDTIPPMTFDPTITTTTTTESRYIPRYADMIGTRKYIPCAVCDIEEQSEHRMIPAESTCPNGWQLQYQGYLMNYHHGTQAGNVICVSDQALGISPSSDAGIRKIVSQYLSHIVIDCKTFPCPPLNHAELLKCVVCSK